MIEHVSTLASVVCNTGLMWTKILKFLKVYSISCDLICIELNLNISVAIRSISKLTGFLKHFRQLQPFFHPRKFKIFHHKTFPKIHELRQLTKLGNVKWVKMKIDLFEALHEWTHCLNPMETSHHYRGFSLA